MVPYDEFSLSGFIGEFRQTYRTACWPFPEESASFGSWYGLSCTRNIDADGTNDSELPSNGLNGSSSIILSQSELNSPTAIDQREERNTDIAGNAVVVNEDVNCERSHNDDQMENPVVENEDVNCERSQQEDHTGNAVVENEDVNCERSQQDDHRDHAAEENEDVNCGTSHKDDQTGNNALVVNEDVNRKRSQNDDRRITRSASKKVHPPPSRTYPLRNKSTKNAVVEEPIGGNKRAEKQPNVGQLAETEIAACVEDTEPEESERRKPFIAGAPTWTGRSSRTRRHADISGKPKTRSRDNIPKKASLRASRRVSTAGAASGSASKTVDSTNHGGSQPTGSGLDIDPIKGKKKNARFQIDDDEPDSSDPEVVEEDDWEPFPPSAKRTKKVQISNKKRAATAIDPSNEASSSVQPSLNENETVPSPPREQRTEERVGNSTQVAAQSTVAQKDASIPNTGRELGTGPGSIFLGSNNNNHNQRSAPSSTLVAAQSTVPQKDASVSDRKGKGVMVQSGDGTENTNAVVPQEPKTPFLFDLNETYEDVTSLEDNTIAARARDEDRVPVRPVQNSVESYRPRQNSYMPSSSVMPPPPVVQESRRSSSRRSSNPFPGYSPQLMGNVPMATPHHHPSPSTYQQAIRAPPRHYREPSPPVWASSSSTIPPQYHRHHHHLSPPPPPPPPFNMDYSSMFAQAPSSETYDLSYLGANLLNQAMMSRMDPRFRSNTPVDHHGDFAFTPRHVHPVNQFDLELQRSHERPPVFPSTISNQGRFQQRRNAAASSSNAFQQQMRNAAARSSNALQQHRRNEASSSYALQQQRRNEASSSYALQQQRRNEASSSYALQQQRRNEASSSYALQQQRRNEASSSYALQQQRRNEASSSYALQQQRRNEASASYAFQQQRRNEASASYAFQQQRRNAVASSSNAFQQQRRNGASSSNIASTSYGVISSDSSECIVSRYPGEITDVETYMVPEEDLRVRERMAEFEQAEDHFGPVTESG